jgi:beta-lactamase class A
MKKSNFLLGISLALVAGIVAGWGLFVLYSHSSPKQQTVKEVIVELPAFRLQQMQGLKYTKPLMYIDKITPTDKFLILKDSLQKKLVELQTAGIITRAALYIKSYKNADCIGINENELFHPGSLIKVPILISYLKMEEQNPGVLNKRIRYKVAANQIVPQTFNSKQIIPNASYTLRELLKYMIAYSDNNATYLLNQNLDLKVFVKMFTDIGLAAPDVMSKEFSISAKDYSVFFRVIYNSSYLNFEDSEYAAQLLSQCDFKEGLLSGLPAGIDVIHKFGEWGNDKVHQLHEAGFFYYDNSTYLITIMTEGNDVKKLPNAIGSFARTTYQQVVENALSDK